MKGDGNDEKNQWINPVPHGGGDAFWSCSMLQTGPAGINQGGNIGGPRESSQDKTDETQPLEENMDEDEGGGAGSTGSTEGETGVLEGLMDDAADGAEEMLDGEDRESSSDRENGNSMKETTER